MTFATRTADPIALPPIPPPPDPDTSDDEPRNDLPNWDRWDPEAGPFHHQVLTGDVVLLAEPCPECHGAGEHDTGQGCWACQTCDDGLLVQGYLTATVLPIVDNGHDLVQHYEQGCILLAPHRDTGKPMTLYVKLGEGVEELDLPGAEPGGVAVTFEPVVCTCFATSPRERIAEGRHCAMQVATDLPTGAPLPADVTFLEAAA